MAMDEDFQHPPKQLEIQVIELMLEIDSEKERKTKQRHETHIMGLQTSKYTSISLWGRAAASHMGNGTEVDKTKQREKQSISGGPIHLTKDFNSAELESPLDSKLESIILAGLCRIYVG